MSSPCKKEKEKLIGIYEEIKELIKHHKKVVMIENDYVAIIHLKLDRFEVSATIPIDDLKEYQDNKISELKLIKNDSE